MRRDLDSLAGRAHDLLVIGGGVHGACVAWDAALRGLSVALVERDDFGAATSANSLRIVHGGLRYLSRGDLPRMRESIRERSALLRIAPGLVLPLPVLVPTRGAGTQSRPALRAALALNDLASAGRNRGLEPTHRIPAGRLVSRAEAARLFPPFAAGDTTGGALWHDARIVRPERLTLAFVRSAAERGAVVANYVELERLLTSGGMIRGAEVADRRTGATFRIDARAVAVAAGPWTAPIVAAATGREPGPAPRQALALNLVIGRELAGAAVGIKALSGPGDDPVIGGGRFLFLAPQRGATLVGTWYAVDRPGDPRTTVERGAAALLAELNAVCPGLSLAAADVVRVQWGRLPLKAGLESGRADSLAERPRVRHHAGDGARGLVSVEGVKYTTARAVAATAVDHVLAALGAPDPGCRTESTPLVGAYDVPADDPRLDERIGEAARDEMAVTLADVVFRRTGLGDPPGPQAEAVSTAAKAVGGVLGWDAGRRALEIEDVMRQARDPLAPMPEVAA
jgi:glycerol-3-phosphate dehydrogenase